MSRKPYRGINTFLLSCTEYPRPFWLTYKQANRFGGHVHKGERGLPQYCSARLLPNASVGDDQGKVALWRGPEEMA